jgi:stress-induced morphogen
MALLLGSLRARSVLLQRLNTATTVPLGRCFSNKTAAEMELETKLIQDLPAAQAEVKDVSGGCGTMYHINVVSDVFQGLGIVKQHQLVTKLLKEEIAQWHGFKLNTSAPDLSKE